MKLRSNPGGMALLWNCINDYHQNPEGVALDCCAGTVKGIG
jgi:hypothetical protein